MNHKARAPANSTRKAKWSKTQENTAKIKTFLATLNGLRGLPGCTQPRRQKICSEHFSSDCVPGKISLQ